MISTANQCSGPFGSHLRVCKYLIRFISHTKGIKCVAFSAIIYVYSGSAKIGSFFSKLSNILQTFPESDNVQSPSLR